MPRRRMTIELTEEQFATLNRILPHGMKKPLFQALADSVIGAYRQGGAEAITRIIGRHLDVVNPPE